MEEKEKRDLSSSNLKKNWLLDGRSVEGKNMTEAMFCSIGPRGEGWFQWREDENADWQAEFDHHREENQLATEDEVWRMVWDSISFWQEELMHDIQRSDTDDQLLELTGLTWEDVEITAIECEMAVCEDMAENMNPCPECDCVICDDCQEDGGHCPACDDGYTGIDAMRMALKSAGKKVA
jgi:hypothetical protein